MEYSINVASTPYFGECKSNTTLLEESLAKRALKHADELFQYVENKKKYKNERSNDKKKSKKKIKDKSKSRQKSPKSKKSKIFGKTVPIEQKYENPLVFFIQKKLELRNDFDQNNSEKFLSEKELPFQECRMSEDADQLNN